MFDNLGVATDFNKSTKLCQLAGTFRLFVIQTSAFSSFVAVCPVSKAATPDVQIQINDDSH